MALPCCLTCIHCTVSQASFTSVPQASFIQVSLKLHSQVSLKIHSQIKCPSSQHCSDDIFWPLVNIVLQANIVQMIYFLTTCEHYSSSQHCSDDIFFRTQVLYLTHSVLPDKALHFWLLGFNLSFLLQLKYWLLVVSYSLLRVSFRFHSLIYLLLSINPAFSVHLNH